MILKRLLDSCSEYSQMYYNSDMKTTMLQKVQLIKRLRVYWVVLLETFKYMDAHHLNIATPINDLKENELFQQYLTTKKQHEDMKEKGLFYQLKPQSCSAIVILKMEDAFATDEYNIKKIGN